MKRGSLSGRPRAAASSSLPDVMENSYRRLIRQHLYGSQTLPTKAPDSVVTNYTPAYPYLTYNVSSTNLSRIDQIVHTVGGSANVRVYAYHYVNTVNTGRLAISHEGHSYFNLENHAVHIKALLDNGWNVVLVQMPTVFTAPHPPNDPDPLAVTNHYLWAGPMELANDPGYIRTFFEPALYAKGYLQATYGYYKVIMMGLSGGGWTTNMVAAIDADIAASWCVAGSMDWELRDHLGRSDWEQHCRAGETSVDGTTTQRQIYTFMPREYEDIYAMGATHGRFARQVYIENESPSYFASAGKHTEIDAYIAAANARVSGTVAVGYDTTQTVHEISNWTSDLIISDLASLGIL